MTRIKQNAGSITLLAERQQLIADIFGILSHVI